MTKLLPTLHLYAFQTMYFDGSSFSIFRRFFFFFSVSFTFVTMLGARLADVFSFSEMDFSFYLLLGTSARIMSLQLGSYIHIMKLILTGLMNAKQQKISFDKNWLRDVSLKMVKKNLVTIPETCILYSAHSMYIDVVRKKERKKLVAITSCTFNSINSRHSQSSNKFVK